MLWVWAWNGKRPKRTGMSAGTAGKVPALQSWFYTGS